MEAMRAPSMGPVGDTPRITIGMPTYNGQATIASAIESLLSQSFGDFELIVGDNASTDATVEVATSFAKLDARVRVIRRAVNLGANANYSLLVHEARGEHFKWASCNDWCAPTFLERCIEVLDARPDVVIAYPKTRLFMESLADAADYEDNLDLQQDDPSARFLQVCSAMRLSNAMNGVIRLSALRRTRLMPSYRAADMVMTGHLALLGKFVEIPEYLFYRRMTPETATRLRSDEGTTQHFHPNRGAEMLFQNWKIQAGWSTALLVAPISPAAKLRLLPWMLRAWYWDRRALANDLFEAGRWLTRPRTH